MEDAFQPLVEDWDAATPYEDVYPTFIFRTVPLLRRAGTDDHWIWQRVPYRILTEFLAGYLSKRFELNVDVDEDYRPQQQRDLEGAIKMLQNTPARQVLSAVFIAALERHGWSELQKYVTFSPPTFSLRHLGRSTRRSIRNLMLLALQRSSYSDFLGIYGLSLFDEFTDSEAEAIVNYIARPSRHPYDRRYVIAMATRRRTRPGRLMADFTTALTKALLNHSCDSPFDLESLCFLARYSDAALSELQKKYTPGTSPFYSVLLQLSRAASENDVVMEFWLRHGSESFRYADLSNQVHFGPLQLGQVSALLAGLRSPNAETASLGTRVLNLLPGFDPEARAALLQAMVDDDERPSVRAALMQRLARPDFVFSEVQDEVLTGLFKIIQKGPRLEVSDGALRRKDTFQGAAAAAIVQLAQNQPPVIAQLLKMLRDYWRGQFIDGLSLLFPAASASELKESYRSLIVGDMSGLERECLIIADELAYTQAQRDDLAEFIERLEEGLLPFQISSEADIRPWSRLAWCCLAYAIWIRPYIHAIKQQVPDLSAPSPSVLLALAQFQSVETEQFLLVGTRHGNSFMAIMAALDHALHLLTDLSNESLREYIEFALNSLDDQIREMGARGLGLVDPVGPEFLPLIRQAVVDRRARVRAAAEEALYSISPVNAEVLDLISWLFLDQDSPLREASPRPKLLFRSKVVDSSAIPGLLRLLELQQGDPISLLWLRAYASIALGQLSNPSPAVVAALRSLATQSPREYETFVRPAALLSLGNIRPVTSETIQVLIEALHASPLSTLRDSGGVKSVAANVLAELVLDQEDGLEWNQRLEIAEHLAKAARNLFTAQMQSRRSRNELGIMEDPADAAYVAVKRVSQFLVAAESQKEFIAALSRHAF